MIHSIEPLPPPNANLLTKMYFQCILVINKLCIKGITQAITNSPKVTDNARKLFPTLKISEIIPPVAPFEPIIYEDTKKKFGLAGRKIILCIGQLHRLKNQQLAIDAMAKLIKVSTNSTLILIGGGDLKQLNTYNLKASELIYTGQLEYTELQKFYQIADIVLQTGIYPEGLGLTPFEGLLFKRMPIAIEGSGAAKILTQKNIGMVVSNNSTELFIALNNYISHPEKYEYTIHKGWKYVTTQLTPAYYATKFQEALNKYE